MIEETGSQTTKARKILVAVDGSPQSIRGIEYAVQMAKEKNADLIALYVDTTIGDMDSRGYGTYTLLKDAGDKLDLKGIQSKEVIDVLEKHYTEATKPIVLAHGEAGLDVAVLLAKKQGVKVKPMVKAGHAAQTIVRIAKEENVDIIVIGSHGLTGFDKLLLGSVADKVSRLAQCQVLIVKPESR